MKVEGTVTGIANVSIANIVAGLGGTGVANAGDGADGAKCGCDGGLGGTATATGGNGGTATSRNVPSIGGNGGNANVYPGKGGNGGSCGPDKTGGKGGDVVVEGGEAGTGRTSDGVDGRIQNQTGGNGGNGGDGCREGKGGKGGNGQPVGQNGKDGKNLCVITNTNTPPPPPPPPVQPPPPETDPISVSPGSVSQTHNIGGSPCPQSIGSLSVGGTTGTWTVSGAPAWMNIARSGSIPGTASVSFNCNISNFTSHAESATLTFTAADGSKATVDVKVNVKAE